MFHVIVVKKVETKGFVVTLAVALADIRQQVQQIDREINQQLVDILLSIETDATLELYFHGR